MKIAFLAWESLHSVAVGGVAVHVTELAAALERKGHEVHVFTRMRWHNDWQYHLIDGVHYHRVPYAGASDIVDDANNMCRAIVNSVFHVEDYMGAHFDIVHAHDWMTANAMAWIKQGRGRRAVLTMHSTEYGRCGNNFYGGRCQRIMDHERNGTYCADRVITVSNALKAEVMWIYNVHDWKVHVIYNGISFEQFNGYLDPGGVKARYGIGPLDPTCLFVGRMTRQKGPDLLIEAIPAVLKYHPSAKFILTGDGDLRGAVEHRAAQVGVAHACRFYGVFPRQEIIDIYKSVDCVVVPSRNEPFGIVVLEAWAAGKPVIGTMNGGPSELIWHDVTGFRIWPNPDSIAWGVGSLFADFEHGRWMGANGRKAAETVYSWNTIADQTLGVYSM
jgi:glycosyltransferase involved in cell wall biosynthesis